MKDRCCLVNNILCAFTLNIPASRRPPLRHGHPRSHHIPSPTPHYCRSLPYPHGAWHHPQAVLSSLLKEAEDITVINA